MKNLNKEFEELLSLKDKYETKRCYIGSKIGNMSIEDVNKILKKIPCRYSYDEDAHFEVEAVEEENDNCTLDTVYKFKCCNCETKHQCHFKFKNWKKWHLPSAIVEIAEEMLVK